MRKLLTLLCTLFLFIGSIGAMMPQGKFSSTKRPIIDPTVPVAVPEVKLNSPRSFSLVGEISLDKRERHSVPTKYFESRRLIERGMLFNADLSSHLDQFSRVGLEDSRQIRRRKKRIMDSVKLNYPLILSGELNGECFSHDLIEQTMNKMRMQGGDQEIDLERLRRSTLLWLYIQLDLGGKS